MNLVQEIKDIKDFEMTVLNAEGLTVVDFWAPWCPGCIKIGPVLESISGKLENVKIVKVDVDDCPDIAQKYDILSIPTLKIFKDGKLIEAVYGFKPEFELTNIIKSLM